MQLIMPGPGQYKLPDDTFGNKGKTLYLVSLDKIRFFQKVIPDDRLILKTRMIYWKNGLGKFYAESFVKNKLVCKSDFTLVLSETVQSRK